MTSRKPNLFDVRQMLASLSILTFELAKRFPTMRDLSKFVDLTPLESMLHLFWGRPIEEVGLEPNTVLIQRQGVTKVFDVRVERGEG